MSMKTLGTIDYSLLEQLFDHLPDIAFFIKDAEGKYRVVNHSIVDRHGFRSKSQMIGCCPTDICPGELGKVLAEQDAQVLRSGQPILDRLELHWYSPQTPGWCLTTKLPILDDKGVVVGILGVSQDVRLPVETDEIPQGVAAALRYLEDHFQSEVSPSSLAREAKLSPTRFARIIKRVFGMTPNQLISKTRLTEAARLLRETERSIAEIGLACGFYDHSAFTRAFRSAMGASPSEFRREREGF